jgi:hypothetical protein
MIFNETEKTPRLLLKWNLFFNSDNKPPSELDTRNDWGTSFDFEFNFQQSQYI